MLKFQIIMELNKLYQLLKYLISYGNYLKALYQPTSREDDYSVIP